MGYIMIARLAPTPSLVRADAVRYRVMIAVRPDARSQHNGPRRIADHQHDFSTLPVAPLPRTAIPSTPYPDIAATRERQGLNQLP